MALYMGSARGFAEKSEKKRCPLCGNEMSYEALGQICSNGHEALRYTAMGGESYFTKSDSVAEKCRELKHTVTQDGDLWNISVAPEQKSGCFIATACYGSPDHLSVVILREYRDRRLLCNALGRSFIRFYYLVSPTIARFLARRQRLASFVRKHLLDAIVSHVQRTTGSRCTPHPPAQDR